MINRLYSIRNHTSLYVYPLESELLLVDSDLTNTIKLKALFFLLQSKLV